MTSTANMIIVAVIVAIVVIGGLWVLWHNRLRLDAPPPIAEEPKAAPPPLPAAEPEIPSAVKPAPKPRATPARKAPSKAPEAAPAKPAAAKPAKAAAPTAIGVPGAIGAPDNLLQLKGLGPKLNSLLNSLGIVRFDQIAAWTADDVAKVDAHLGAFKGRIERDSWIEQAGLLAKGAIAEFEAKFGKLDSENK